MSSGFFGFFAHFGCLAALEEAGLDPARISGSSAGALAGAVWASGCPMSGLKKRLFNLTKADFWDPAPGFGLLKGNRFRNLLGEICAVPRIEDCRVPLAISVFDLTGLASRSLREGSIVDAVYASCCVPFLFQPIRIGRSIYLDGGIGDRPGLAGTPQEGRTLCHHLQSSRPGVQKDQIISRILKERPNTIAVTVKNIEPIGPATGKDGRRAFDQTRAAVRAALARPIIGRQVLA